jgi:hypothetical protein
MDATSNARSFWSRKGEFDKEAFTGNSMRVGWQWRVVVVPTGGLSRAAAAEKSVTVGCFK